jgi:hypothetical protein
MGNAHKSSGRGTKGTDNLRHFGEYLDMKILAIVLKQLHEYWLSKA